MAYSDDGGTTWKAGGLVPAGVQGLNECSVAELPGGKLLLNMRNRQAKCRAVATSDDGGLGWSLPQLVDELVDPQCQGALLRLPGSGPARLLFSNAADFETPAVDGATECRRGPDLVGRPGAAHGALGLLRPGGHCRRNDPVCL